MGSVAPDNCPDFLGSDLLEVPPNGPIEIYRGPCTFLDGGDEAEGESTLEYDWYPSPKLRLTTKVKRLTGFGSFFLSPGIEQFHLSKFWGGQDVTILFERFGSIENGAEIVGSVEPFVAGDASNLEEIRFHLINGPKYRGSITRDGKGFFTSRASLLADGWQIDLDALSFRCPKEHLYELKRRGGYSVTHVGRIRKEDGCTFEASEIEHVLKSLEWFLAFCCGGWSGVTAIRGYKNGGENVFGAYRPLRVSKLPNNRTWLTAQMDSPLSEVFSGFVDRWNEDQWHEVIERAVYWYVASNKCEGGVEGAAVLAFATLEALSWAVCVEDQALLSSEGFDKLAASDKIRLLLRHCRIPVEIPSTLEALQAIAKAEQNVTDGLDAISYIRNRYVHSTPKNRLQLQKLGDGYGFETWWLTMHYVELVLLFLFGFKGRHLSRIGKAEQIGGEIRFVPWADDSDCESG